MFHRCTPEGDNHAGFVRDVWSNIDRLSEAEQDVVLDLSRVDFLDSHCIGAIMTLVRRLALKGLQLKVIGLHGQPLRLLLDLNFIPVSGLADVSAKTHPGLPQQCP